MENKFIISRALYHLHNINANDSVDNIFPEITFTNTRNYLEDVLSTSEFFDNAEIGNLVKGYKLKQPVRKSIVENGIESFIDKNYNDKKKAKRRESNISFPQRYWWLILLLSAILFPYITYILTKEKSPNQKMQQNIPTLIDSSMTHKK